eukprot:NODE_148_length_15570_cov_0.950100.p3 type:complete len:608 gc:universal NODE_148_length_15570_cov_0.950100:7747-9570(+)
MLFFHLLIFGAYNAVLANQNNIGHTYYQTTLPKKTLRSDCQKLCDADSFCYALVISTANECFLKYYFSPNEIVAYSGANLYTKTVTTGMSLFFWARGYLTQVHVQLVDTSAVYVATTNTAQLLATSLDEKFFFNDMLSVTAIASAQTAVKLKYGASNDIVEHEKSAYSYLIYEATTMTGNYDAITGSYVTLKMCFDFCLLRNCKFVFYDFSTFYCTSYTEGTETAVSNVFALNQTRMLNLPILDTKLSGTPYLTKSTTYEECYKLCFIDYACNAVAFNGVTTDCSFFTTYSGQIPAAGFFAWKIINRPSKTTSIVSATKTSSVLLTTKLSTTTSPIIKISTLKVTTSVVASTVATTIIIPKTGTALYTTKYSTQVVAQIASQTIPLQTTPKLGFSSTSPTLKINSISSSIILTTKAIFTTPNTLTSQNPAISPLLTSSLKVTTAPETSSKLSAVTTQSSITLPLSTSNPSVFSKLTDLPTSTTLTSSSEFTLDLPTSDLYESFYTTEESYLESGLDDYDDDEFLPFTESIASETEDPILPNLIIEDSSNATFIIITRKYYYKQTTATTLGHLTSKLPLATFNYISLTTESKSTPTFNIAVQGSGNLY